MTKTTEWLDQARHPSESERFALPSAVYFLLKFRADLAEFSCKTLTDRIALYLWWESVARTDYPDFDWKPRSQDLAYVEQLDNATLISEYPRSIAYWLKSTAPSILDGKNLTATLLEPADIDGPSGFDLPAFLAVIVEDRADLKQVFDLTTVAGRLGCVSWWQERGQVEYPRIAWSPAEIFHALLETHESSRVDEVPCPRLLHLIRNERADLRQAYDLDTFAGRIAFLGWWREHRKDQYPSIRWILSGVPERLFEPEDANNATGIPLPRFLNLICHDRADLRQAFDLKTLTGRLAALTWWDSEGQFAYPVIQWSTNALLPTLLASEPAPGTGAATVPKFLESIRRDRADLTAAFDTSTRAGATALVSWWQNHGRKEYPTLCSISLATAGENSDGGGNQYVMSIERAWRARPFGVNIVGFPQGVLGLGEDARMASKALGLSAIPCALINAPMAGPAKLDTSVDHLLSVNLKYGLSVFCLPPPEMLRLSLEGGRNLIEADTYKIGAWPWELPQWPSAFGKLHRLVDEIWAQSRFVQSAFARQADTAVHHVPMAVSMPAPVNPDRSRFGLPSNEFLFYLMFDGNSWLTRKNPIAGIHAFQKAFGAQTSGVSLIVKAMNVRDSDPTWRAVCELAAQDARIRIVSERLSRQDTVDFMAACDAYISLHRSEGFGRVIAEAMLLGQPVVVTNFSGNVDFCDEQTSFLVDGDLVPLRAGDYLFHEGQYWCDPDVSTAAEQIRTAFEDKDRRKRVAKAGQARILRDYSIEAVARAYADRLAEIKAGVVSP
ncbi:glycosyltransferase family 4 protein [Paraburkholderia caffeinilytica]|uniref:glycosyltransferase family 4 protein n=1 Tax=Paraburkholderia caffeinilytica TaxID=1761016 RepID=UPI0038BD224F